MNFADLIVLISSSGSGTLRTIPARLPLPIGSETQDPIHISRFPDQSASMRVRSSCAGTPAMLPSSWV